MKFGFRTPSVKKSISARTTGKVKRAMKSAVNPTYGKKGAGILKDPKKAIYNKAYNRTTINVKDLLTGNKKREHKKTSTSSIDTMAKNDLRVIKRCINIMDSAKNPNVFFSNLDLLENTSKHLCCFETSINFSGALPSQALNEFYANKDEAIARFLQHYWNLTYQKVASLKTNKGKLNAYKKFYDSLKPYENYFNTNNLQFYQSKKKYIEYFTK